MKSAIASNCKPNHSALTLIDVLVIVATIVFGITFFFAYVSRSTGCGNRSQRITCVNNLKQVGLSFRLYAGDNRDRYPMNISTNDEPVVNEMTPVYKYLGSLSNELGTPKVVICPDDKKRKTATNFATLGNKNISYFSGLDAAETLPQSMLAGDRNITNDFPPRRNILELTTNQMVRFTEEIHKLQGNIALGDGSVQQVSSARLRSEIIKNTPFATNRIKLP
jgi:hypothetical protein